MFYLSITFSTFVFRQTSKTLYRFLLRYTGPPLSPSSIQVSLLPSCSSITSRTSGTSNVAEETIYWDQLGNVPKSSISTFHSTRNSPSSTNETHLIYQHHPELIFVLLVYLLPPNLVPYRHLNHCLSS